MDGEKSKLHAFEDRAYADFSGKVPAGNDVTERAASERILLIHEGARQLAHRIIDLTPTGPEQWLALRLLMDATIAATTAIAGISLPVDQEVRAYKEAVQRALEREGKISDAWEPLLTAADRRRARPS